MLERIPKQYDEVFKPRVEFDLMDLYKLCYFLGESFSTFLGRLHLLKLLLLRAEMERFTDKLHMFCLGRVSPNMPFHAVEHKIASVMARCSRDNGETLSAAESDLFKHMSAKYVSVNMGLPCLCRWPLLYKQVCPFSIA